jgi:hypothetical protein
MWSDEMEQRAAAMKARNLNGATRTRLRRRALKGTPAEALEPPAKPALAPET